MMPMSAMGPSRRWAGAGGTSAFHPKADIVAGPRNVRL